MNLVIFDILLLLIGCPIIIINLIIVYYFYGILHILHQILPHNLIINYS